MTTENKNRAAEKKTTGDCSEFTLPDFILKSRLPNTAKQLYGYLLRQTEDGSQPCCQTQSELAEAAGGVSERHVINCLKVLIHLGLVKKVRQGKTLSNIYTVTADEKANRAAVSSWRSKGDAKSCLHQSGSSDVNSGNGSDVKCSETKRGGNVGCAGETSAAADDDGFGGLGDDVFKPGFKMPKPWMTGVEFEEFKKSPEFLAMERKSKELRLAGRSHEFGKTREYLAARKLYNETGRWEDFPA